MQTRQQARAQHAYQCVADVPENLRDNYRTIANQFGANVMRSGLCAAVAFVHRQVSYDDGRHQAGTLYVHHLAMYLASMRLLGAHAHASHGDGLLAVVRAAPLEQYMLVTREVLHLAVWLRRAVQSQPTQERHQCATSSAT